MSQTYRSSSRSRKQVSVEWFRSSNLQNRCPRKLCFFWILKKKNHRWRKLIFHLGKRNRKCIRGWYSRCLRLDSQFHRYYTIVVSITSIYYDWLSILPLPGVSVITNWANYEWIAKSEQSNLNQICSFLACLAICQFFLPGYTSSTRLQNNQLFCVFVRPLFSTRKV